MNIGQRRIWLGALFGMFLIAGCAAIGPRHIAPVPENPVGDVKNWEGVWIEEWPDSDQQDRFRISLSADGFTIQVVPLTNVERQRLAELHWDGKTLQFTNYADDRPIAYSLEINADGTVLTGDVRASDGEESAIRWTKEGAPGTAGATAESAAKIENLSLGNWSGNWEESWPDRAERDVYRVRSLDDDRRVALDVLTNVERQGVAQLAWNGRRLAFLLRFNDNEIGYEMFQFNADTLVGLANMPDGSVRRVVWNRVGPPYQDGKPTARHWAGTWKEYWPTRAENDLYQIKKDAGKGLSVQAVTNGARQNLQGLQNDGEALTFELQYDQTLIVYQLHLDDRNTIRGTVRLPDGQTRAVAWVRIGN